MSHLLRLVTRCAGLRVTGDIGPLTVWTNRNLRVVAMVKSPPTTPPSPLQRANRQLWQDCASAWRTLTPAQKQDWEAASKDAKAMATGYNLFTKIYLTGDLSLLALLREVTGRTCFYPGGPHD